MKELNALKETFVNDFYQNDFNTAQHAASWITDWLELNLKESLEKAAKYDDLGKKVEGFYLAAEKDLSNPHKNISLYSLREFGFIGPTKTVPHKNDA